MIINGREAFVGSDAGRARRAIAKSLSVQPESRISVTIDQSAVDLKVKYACNKPAPNAVVNHYVSKLRCGKAYHRMRSWRGSTDHLNLL